MHPRTIGEGSVGKGLGEVDASAGGTEHLFGKISHHLRIQDHFDAFTHSRSGNKHSIGCIHPNFFHFRVVEILLMGTGSSKFGVELLAQPLLAGVGLS